MDWSSQLTLFKENHLGQMSDADLARPPGHSRSASPLLAFGFVFNISCLSCCPQKLHPGTGAVQMRLVAEGRGRGPGPVWLGRGSQLHCGGWGEKRLLAPTFLPGVEYLLGP